MLSVLVATHNGSATVGQFLKAIAVVEPPCCGWELIVVDNGSTDDTPNLLRGHDDRLPILVLEHKNRGKNRALNHGLRHVSGDVIVLTDDDVLPDRQWLMRISEATLEHGDVDLFGGAILPYWEQSPPTWLETAIPFGAAFGITPSDLKAGPVEPGCIWGGNMFLRRRVFDAGFRFNEHVGPGAGNYIMGSETEFTRRVAAAGYSTWWCPDVQVRHIIHKEQLSRKWLLRRAYRHGKSVFFHTPRYLPAAADGPIWFRLNFPKFIIREAIEALLRALLRDVARNAPGALQQWWRFFHFAGYIEQARHFRS